MENSDVLIAGLDYPDTPSAEGFMPNYQEAYNRGSIFANLLRGTSGLIDRKINADETDRIIQSMIGDQGRKSIQIVRKQYDKRPSATRNITS